MLPTTCSPQGTKSAFWSRALSFSASVARTVPGRPEPVTVASVGPTGGHSFLLFLCPMPSAGLYLTPQKRIGATPGQTKELLSKIYRCH